MNSSAQRYAAELKRRIATKQAKYDYDLYITQPVLGCDLGDLPGMPLVAWMHFNPLGPTTSSLFYVPVPGAEEGLITFRSDSPFVRHHAAFGVMPHDVAAGQIGEVAFMLFAASQNVVTSPLHGGARSTLRTKNIGEKCYKFSVFCVLVEVFEKIEKEPPKGDDDRPSPEQYPKTVQTRARNGQVPAYRVGRYWRYRASKLNQRLEELHKRAIPGPENSALPCPLISSPLPTPCTPNRDKRWTPRR